MEILEENEILAPKQAEAAEHDLVEELHHQLDSLCRCSEHIIEAEAEGHPQVQRAWRELQQQEAQTIDDLKRKAVESLEHGVPQEGF